MSLAFCGGLTCVCPEGKEHRGSLFLVTSYSGCSKMGCDTWGVSVPILFFSGVWHSAEGQNMVYNNRTSLFSSEIKIDFNLYLKVYFYCKGFLKDLFV